MQTSPTIGAIAKAFAAAQVELENVTKDRENPHFKSQYATLAAVLDVVRPVLSKHGIGIVQAPGNNDAGAVTVTTTLVHESGEWLQSCVVVPTGKNDAQGVGSAISYGRRYALAAMCGVAQEDDDANAAVASGANTQGRQGAQTAPVRSAPVQNISARPEPELTPKQKAARQCVARIEEMGLMHEERELVARIDNELHKFPDDDFRVENNRIKALYEAFKSKGE